jgi:HK97 family phage prohead protease
MEAVKSGAAPPDALLRKQYVAQVRAVDGKDGAYTFCISTGSVDRESDTLAVAGWDTRSYEANPVVLYAHNQWGLPIGKATSLTKGTDALLAEMEFVAGEVYAFAGTVRALVDGGYLRATSVGFRPIKYLWNSERKGYDFAEQELLEFSIVPVPANPEALRKAAAAGIDLAPMREWAEGVLDSIEPGLWLPKAAAERALRIVGGERSSVAVAVNPEPAPAPVPAQVPTEAAPKVVITMDNVRAALQAGLREAAGAAVRRAQGRLD